LEVLAFVVTGTLVIFWSVLNTHTNKQTNKQSVCVFIPVVSFIFSIFFFFAPEKSNSE